MTSYRLFLIVPTIIIFNNWLFVNGLTKADVILPVLFLILIFNQFLYPDWSNYTKISFVILGYLIAHNLLFSFAKGSYDIFGSSKTIVNVGILLFISNFASKQEFSSSLILKITTFVILLLSILRLTNLSIFDDKYHEMIHLRPFFNSIDNALVFMLLQAALLQFNKCQKLRFELFYFYFPSIICFIMVVLSGSRISILIWLILFTIYLIRKNIFVFVGLSSSLVFLLIVFVQNVTFSEFVNPKIANLLEIIFKNPQALLAYSLMIFYSNKADNMIFFWCLSL